MTSFVRCRVSGSMQCERARSLIFDYESLNDGDVEPERHLLECRDCHAEFEELQRLWTDLGHTQVPIGKWPDTRAVLIADLKWRTTMRTLLKTAVLLVLVAGLAAGAGLLVKREARVDAPAMTHILGPQNASVTLVEYGDYECPPCFARQYHLIIDRLLKKYPDTVRYEFRHFPIAIHPNALPAAMAAEAASAQGKFWEMHRLLLSSHDRWYQSADPGSVFVDLAGQLQLDVKTFTRDLNSEPIRQRILQEAKIARDAGIGGTPAFLLNGRRLDPAPKTLEEFESRINDAKE